MTQGKVLFIDDDKSSSELLGKLLLGRGFSGDFRFCSKPELVINEVSLFNPHVCVLDLALDGKDPEIGLKLISKILKVNQYVRIIVLTGYNSDDYGIEALSSGASSFLVKPVCIEHLHALINDALSQSSLLKGLQDKITELNRGKNLELEQSIVGVSEHVKKLRNLVNFAASNSSSLLITGETGTGKSMCAHLVHTISELRGKFIRYQPNVTSGDLFSSDLFGHSKGAFTGAIANRKGLIAESTRGTLFIDEISEIPSASQVSLLGVLQDKKFRPLGDNREQSSNFRLITATNSDLSERVNSGEFRRDLLHRIAQIHIHIPPLRERKEDIPYLVDRIKSDLCIKGVVGHISFPKEVINKLMSLKWLGNVRELESVIISICNMVSYEGRTFVAVDDIENATSYGVTDFCNFSSSAGGGTNVADGDLSFSELVEEYKASLVLSALNDNDGNQTKAAKSLKMDRTYLRKIYTRAFN